MLTTISNQTARRLFLQRQGLTRAPQRKLDRQGLLDLIEQLGFVQVDSISTVERAHHMILFARSQGYRPTQLTRLLERDAALFENWTHDASIIPTRFFPYWLHRFERERPRLLARFRKWRRDGFEEMLDEVLQHVHSHGPVRSRDLLERAAESGATAAGGAAPSGQGWWDWHPSKTALEFHWRTGGLAVARREGFQKVYDLTERVIPAEHRCDAPDSERFIDWACRSALERLGFASPGEVAAFWGLITPEEAKAWCAPRLGGELRQVLIEPANGESPRKALAWADIETGLDTLPEPPGRLRLLSPFDPLIRDRKRLQRLFGFDYRIEVFVPEAKRRYGYYVFPLLEGDRLVGRVDIRNERVQAALVLSALWLEPGIRMTAARRRALEAELERQRRFVGAERVRVLDGYLATAG